MAYPPGERISLVFDRKIELEFHGAKVTSDAGLLAYRELDDAMGLIDAVPSFLHDNRTGRHIQHAILSLLRPGHVQSTDR